MDQANQTVTKYTENNASSKMSTGSQITRYCSRCRSHGLKISQKGHRKDCMYRDCTCLRCKLFSDRRSTMSRHIRLRTLTQDEDSTSLSIDGSSLGSGPQSMKNLEGSNDSNSGDLSVSNHGSNETQDENNDVIRITSSKKAVSSNRSSSATKSWLQRQPATTSDTQLIFKSPCSMKYIESSARFQRSQYEQLSYSPGTTDSNISWDTSSTSNSGTNLRTKPMCTLCRNHNVVNVLKGHKRYCPFLYCICPPCRDTHEHRKQMAKQTALKRELIQDEEQIKKFGKLVKPTMPPQQTNHIPTVLQPVWNIEGGDGINNLINTSTPRKVPVDTIMPPWIDFIQPQPNVNVEIILARSMTLLQQFRYPFDMLTLMYVTVKYAGANLEEALRRIDEANNDIKSLEIFNMVKKFWNENLFYFSEYIPKTDITDAPTYEGEVPFIGDPPSQDPEHFTLLPHLKNTRIPTNDSFSEHYTK